MMFSPEAKTFVVYKLFAKQKGWFTSSPSALFFILFFSHYCFRRQKNSLPAFPNIFRHFCFFPETFRCRRKGFELAGNIPDFWQEDILRTVT